MKKKLLIAGAIVIAIIVALAGVYFIGSGFKKQSNVYILDYEISEDGTEMTINAGVAASIGYIRDVKIKQNDGMLCLDFYAGFGGINGSIGAKNKYVIPISEDTNSIAILKDKSYEVVLTKDSEGNWSR